MVSKSEQLEILRAKLGLSKANFARLMDIKPNYYTHISNENGKGNLGIKHLEALVNSTNANPVWILTGQGEMFLSNSNQSKKIEPTEEQVEALYNLLCEREKMSVELRTSHMTKFLCSHVIWEFPDAQSLHELLFAARAYLRAGKRMSGVDFFRLLGVENPLSESESHKPDANGST